MRILHVLDHSLPLHSGYTFRTIAILNEQKKRGWDTVHATSAKHDPEMTQGAVDEVEGRSYFRSEQPPPWMNALPVFDQVGVVRTLETLLSRVIEKTKPDIVHAHSPALNGYAAYRVCKRLGLPFVYELRALWEDGAVDLGKTKEGSLRYRASRWLETHVMQHADAVTTICEGLRRDIVGRGLPAEKVAVVPNAVDLSEFAGPAPQSAAIGERLNLSGHPVLGFIGSFYRWEGLDFLLEAVPEIVGRHPDARVLLIGGGPEDENLRRRASALGIADRVTFTGRVPHADVCAYYDLIDIVVYPRRSMRLTELVTPLKPLEAMARGRMVLASNVGGHRELVTDGSTGFLFDAENPIALAASVTAMLEQQEQWPAIKSAGRSYVAEERTWQRSVAAYEPVYARLMR